MAAPSSAKLAFHVIRDHFGEHVEAVFRCIVRKGLLGLSMQDIARQTGLSPPLLRNCLLVLVQHNCVQPFRLSAVALDENGQPRPQQTLYFGLLTSSLQRLRFPKFLQHVRETLGEDAESVLEACLEHGRLSFAQLLEREAVRSMSSAAATAATTSSVGGDDKDVKRVARQRVQKAMAALVAERMLERVGKTEPSVASREADGVGVKPGARRTNRVNTRAMMEAAGYFDSEERRITAAARCDEADRFRMPSSCLPAAASAAAANTAKAAAAVSGAVRETAAATAGFSGGGRTAGGGTGRGAAGKIAGGGSGFGIGKGGKLQQGTEASVTGKRKTAPQAEAEAAAPQPELLPQKKRGRPSKAAQAAAAAAAAASAAAAAAEALTKDEEAAAKKGQTGVDVAGATAASGAAANGSSAATGAGAAGSAAPPAAALSGEAEERDVLWRVNYEEFLRRFRHKAVVACLQDMVDPAAGVVAAAMLDFGKSNESSVRHPYSASLSLETVANAVRASAEGRMMAMTLERIRAILQAMVTHPAGLAVRSTDSLGSAHYTLQLRKIVEMMRMREIEAVITQRFGATACRIFRLLQRKKCLEQKQIAELAMVQVAEARQVLYRLLLEEYVHLQEVPKTADHAPTRTFYLWRVNGPRVMAHVLDHMCKATLNLRLRLAHEMEQEHEVLALLEQQMQPAGADGSKPSGSAGATSAATGGASMPLTSAQRQLLERIRKVAGVVESSQLRLDNSLMLFADF